MIYNNLGGQGGAVDDNDDDPLEIRHAAAPRAPRCRARTPPLLLLLLTLQSSSVRTLNHDALTQKVRPLGSNFGLQSGLEAAALPSGGLAVTKNADKCIKMGLTVMKF